MSSPTENTITLRPSNWAMQRFGYKSRVSFWSFVHANAVPFVRLNSRVCRFDERAVEDWIASRTVGRKEAA